MDIELLFTLSSSLCSASSIYCIDLYDLIMCVYFSYFFIKFMTAYIQMRFCSNDRYDITHINDIISTYEGRLEST